MTAQAAAPSSSSPLLASFREVLRGHAPGPLRRQYWAREHGQWKIFSETVSKD